MKVSTTTMSLPICLLFASTAFLATAIPTTPLSKRTPTFTAGSSWDIVLNNGDNHVPLKDFLASPAQTIDVDLFDTEKSFISSLKANGKKVICYFSAGSREDWRPDANEFRPSDYKLPLNGWPGEHWLDVQSANVLNIMKKRIDLAAEKGCDAVDPDNVDGYLDNQSGYTHPPSSYTTYVRSLASHASSKNIAIGLKNALDLIPSVIDVVQFAVNEQCHQYQECGRYKLLTDRNKAVFNIEYGLNDCSQPAGVKLSTLIKPADRALDTLGGACKNQKLRFG